MVDFTMPNRPNLIYTIFSSQIYLTTALAYLDLSAVAPLFIKSVIPICGCSLLVQQQPILTSPSAVVGGPNASFGAGAPFSTAIHRRTASKTTSTTPTTKMLISVESR